LIEGDGRVEDQVRVVSLLTKAGEDGLNFLRGGDGVVEGRPQLLEGCANSLIESHWAESRARGGTSQTGRFRERELL